MEFVNFNWVLAESLVLSRMNERPFRPKLYELAIAYGMNPQKAFIRYLELEFDNLGCA
jgi:hypothetical protein